MNENLRLPSLKVVNEMILVPYGSGIKYNLKIGAKTMKFNLIGLISQTQFSEDIMSVSEVECEVSSQVEYSLQAIWGVSIRELHLALWKPWSTLRDASLNGALLQGHAQYLTPPQTYPSRTTLTAFNRRILDIK